jgi:hypothetical protein
MDKDRVKELLEMIDMWKHAEDTFPYLDKRRQADGKFRVVRVRNNINRPEVLGKDLTSREADAFMKMLGDSE